MQEYEAFPKATAIMSQSQSHISVTGSTSTSATSRFVSNDVNKDDNAPLWAYVSLIHSREVGGGNRKWKCNFCEVEFSGSYYRVKSHLLKLSGNDIRVCAKVTQEYLKELQGVVSASEEKCKPAPKVLSFASASQTTELIGEAHCPNLHLVDKILDITRPIYNMLSVCDTDKPNLHLVYDMWDSMIENVKLEIYRHEKLSELEAHCPLYQAIYDILVDRWTKSCTPLYCMAHSLNPRYYSREWLDGGPNRVAPNSDEEISLERNKCLQRFLIHEPKNEYVGSLNCYVQNFFGLLFTYMKVPNFVDFILTRRCVLDPSMPWYVLEASWHMFRKKRRRKSRVWKILLCRFLCRKLIT